MRACFLGHNVCALGFGVAMVQAQPRAEESGPAQSEPPFTPDVATPNVDSPDLLQGPYIHRQFWTVSSGQS